MNESTGTMSLLMTEDLNAPEERMRAIYQAFTSGDVRYDGRVFVGVASTGVYCRTVCHAKMPKYENCTFYHTAAEAEAAGYRPCMTCRPEMAPGLSLVDAESNLARRAALMMRDRCAERLDMEKIAERLGYTSRHVRRAFLDEYGVPPAQYLQTCRLLTAKSLLTDTDLPVAQVAKASGFGSVRRFNQVFQDRYRLTPMDVRKSRRRPRTRIAAVTIRLGYRPPYRFSELLEFFRVRAIPNVEIVDEVSYSRTVRIADDEGGVASGWVRVENDESRNQVVITMNDELAPSIPRIVARIRRMFDLDSDPAAIASGLEPLREIKPAAMIEGVRMPGCFDPFETACRAVLGQQISVKAANGLARRIVETYGELVETGIDGLTRAWPTPQTMLALNPIEDALGPLGVIKARTHVMWEIARMIVEGELDFTSGARIDETVERLLTIKGIGPWTAGYIAMRTLSHPDVFLETDAGIVHALPNLTPKERIALVEPCRPWRSYATIAFWNTLTE